MTTPSIIRYTLLTFLHWQGVQAQHDRIRVENKEVHVSEQEEQSSRLVRCAEPGCTTWFTITRENAFQRYCSEHATQQKRRRRASTRKTPKRLVEK